MDFHDPNNLNDFQRFVNEIGRKQNSLHKGILFKRCHEFELKKEEEEKKQKKKKKKRRAKNRYLRRRQIGISDNRYAR